MLKVIVYLPVIVLILCAVAWFFFGFKPSLQAGGRTSVVLTSIAGILLVAGACAAVMEHNLLFIGLLVSFLFVLVLTPILSVGTAVSEGGFGEGPYKKMSPEEKTAFWNGTRRAAKIGAKVYAAYAESQNQHTRARAADFLRRAL